jgi:hypothetical protein
MKTGELSGGHFARQMEKVHSCSHGIRKKSEKNPMRREKSRKSGGAKRPKSYPALRSFTISMLSNPYLLRRRAFQKNSVAASIKQRVFALL